MRRVAWYLAGVMIAPDHQQFLARHAVSPRWIAVNAAVAHVQAFDNGKAYRRAARRSSRSLVGTWGGAWVLILLMRHPQTMSARKRRRLWTALMNVHQTAKRLHILFGA